MYRKLPFPFYISIATLFLLPLIVFYLIPQLGFFPFSPSLPPPISPSDELFDLVLLRRASKSYSSHLSSNSRSPKIAFLFLTNTHLHFSPLWQSFFLNSKASSSSPPRFNVYVHSSPSLNLTFHPSSVFYGRVIPSKATYRASPTLISATRRLIAHAILHDPANQYFALVSQHCVPLHSFDYVYNSLFKSTSFDLTDDDKVSAKIGVKLRFRSYMEVLDQSKNHWKRYTARGRYAMEPEVPYEKFRVGSQFFIIMRKHAYTVVRDRKLWAKFKVPCYREYDCYPEEHYFPTLLDMEDPKGVTRYTLTRVNWTGTVEGHPYTYSASEVLPQLIHDLRKSNYSASYLFARKFKPDCLQPLMKIADSVIFQD
ncbi:hypothetical protein MLD38_011722 [Melastoma candidum]|uniref:Uncharacterized protein n=1 Tax=Melastoma candidum TaxID=119954 RepID=A0ACB9R405_9MYRT|nr:hypothetical protein MLD38_011722 [Melastoma candidum]